MYEDGLQLVMSLRLLCLAQGLFVFMHQMDWLMWVGLCYSI